MLTMAQLDERENLRGQELQIVIIKAEPEHLVLGARPCKSAWALGKHRYMANEDSRSHGLAPGSCSVRGLA